VQLSSCVSGVAVFSRANPAHSSGARFMCVCLARALLSEYPTACDRLFLMHSLSLSLSHVLSHILGAHSHLGSDLRTIAAESLFLVSVGDSPAAYRSAHRYHVLSLQKHKLESVEDESKRAGKRVQGKRFRGRFRGLAAI